MRERCVSAHSLCASTKSHTQTCWQMNKIIKKVTHTLHHILPARENEDSLSFSPSCRLSLCLSRIHILSAKWKYPLLAKTRARLMEMCVCGNLVCRIVCRYGAHTHTLEKSEREAEESLAKQEFCSLSCSALIQFSPQRSTQVKVRK